MSTWKGCLGGVVVMTLAQNIREQGSIAYWGTKVSTHCDINNVVLFPKNSYLVQKRIHSLKKVNCLLFCVSSVNY